MKKIYSISLLLFLFSATTWSQEVSFTPDYSTLQEGSYEDCVVDMNGDFLDDIVRVMDDGIKIYYQSPEGGFTTKKFTMTLHNYPSWSICAGDLNGDGFNDLLFGSGSQVSFIFSQNGGTSYTEEVMPEYIFSQRSSMADIDNDGDLDAFVCHDVDQSHPYRNDGTGHMVLDQSLIETADLAGNYAVLWVDYDNDWDTDLYITKCRQGSTSGDIERTNLMYRNNGDGTYTEVGAEINMNDNAQSWTTVFEDFDNDGDFDAFIVNHDFANRFMLNDGTGHFTDIIESTGINPYDLGAWENASADFNNDGYMDILSEMSKELYINNGDLTFTPYDLPVRSGGFGDLNNDGYVDIVSGNAIYYNNGSGNNWIKINTTGLLSNPNGIGANVAIYGSWGKQMKEVRSTQSFSPMSSISTYFGIGDATAIDSIVIKWPSHLKTVIPNPSINTSLDVIEGECILEQTAIQIEGAPEICEGSTVTLTAPDGFASYSWSNGMTSQSIEVGVPGIYSVVSKDSMECVSASNRVTVSYIVDPTPVVEVIGKDKFCEGESVTLELVEGTNPVWSNGMTGNSIEVTETGTYTVNVDAVCFEEGIASEPIEITVLDAPLPGDLTIDFSGAMNETATISVTGDSINWYNDFDLTNLVGTGTNWMTPPITEDTYFFGTNTTIYSGEYQQGGKPDISGPGGLPSTYAYSLFDVWEPFSLKSVDVFVPQEAPEGERHIQLMTNENQILEELAIDLVHGLNTIDLNWQIPVGTNLSLRCPENDLFRSQGNLNYPYPIGDFGEITTSIYGTDYYYFFYNWVVRGEPVACVSSPLEVQITLVNVNEIPELNSFSIAPNPATTNINAEWQANETGMLELRLYNSEGKLVSQFSDVQIVPGINKKAIDISRLPKGFYVLKVLMNGHQASAQVVIE